MTEQPGNDSFTGQQTGEIRSCTIGRDQILSRLWYLANLAPEFTRGSIAGQIKALSMIVAIEGLIPDRRTAKASQPAPPVKANIYAAEWLRQPTTTERPPVVAETSSAPPRPLADVPAAGPANPFLDIKGTNWVPGTNGLSAESFVQPRSLKLPRRNPFARGR